MRVPMGAPQCDWSGRTWLEGTGRLQPTECPGHNPSGLESTQHFLAGGVRKTKTIYVIEGTKKSSFHL